LARTSPKGDYLLTPGLRRKLKKPLGRFFPTVDVHGDDFLSIVTSARMVVTVGDRVTETIQEITGRSPDLFVVDGLERRTPREIPKVAHGSTVKAKNPAGRITRAAAAAMKRAFELKKPVMVLIEGEEDLLTIPAVIEAPEGSVVLYGQPLEGVVAVSVSSASKVRAREILREMSG
jgi:GTP-dependent dephospho-CoA kinase